MSSPAVSAIVVVRDGERYLADSLASLIEQSRPPEEVIVVDDGSQDGSRGVAEGFGPPVRVLTQPPSGIAAARNAGVAAARGHIIGFLDADDISAPDALASRLAAFDADPPPDIVWGLARHFRSPELDPQQTARLPCPPDALPAHLPGGALIVRAALERVGPFAVDLRMGEFVDWVARARDLGLREASVPSVVLHRRVHDKNHTLRNRADLSDLTVVMRRALQRRRAPSATS